MPDENTAQNKLKYIKKNLNTSITLRTTTYLYKKINQTIHRLYQYIQPTTYTTPPTQVKRADNKQECERAKISETL